ncbi:ABC transporter related protein [Halothece sp. PCC 7418]|uniref:ABC transporter ATP-binding protein n=1 Tax=Halothece sp. (strain PCC 7418) TaxID=65093 RepID=UPI0002A07027|nr:ABC transporter ATP-binding protein [Halothece sp. PCC 7418]AFZ44785.1 ABC transporter related protein [Halothece sp. PCC 7418]
MGDAVIEVRNLKVEFFPEEQHLIAVNGINFQIPQGKTLGLVGESGSGKSVTALALMGLVGTPGQVTAGEIYFQPSPDTPPVDLLKLTDAQRRDYRGGKIAMIFQEPMSSLNPVYNIGFQITEAIRQHQDVSPSEARRQAIARLQEVKLLPSDNTLKQDCLLEDNSLSETEVNHRINEQKRAFLERYPHQLSGGQLQRVMIAIAISCNPALLIADEPTTALDVTVQKTILNLLRDLCQARGMSMLFITHDLGVVAETADQVAVMYQGNLVESGDIESLFTNPQHPYTKGLLACRPRLDQTLTYLPTVSDFLNRDGELKTNQPQSSQNNRMRTEEKNYSLSEDSSVATAPLLTVQNLQVGFPLRGVFGQAKRYFMAVNGVSFDVYRGETLGLVGESGCGKSTLARTLLKLISPLHGKIFFNGENITNWQGKPLRRLRRQMQIVFQNPYNSLNPRLTIGKTIIEPLSIHKQYQNSRQRQERVAYLLERVGLSPKDMNRYPHEFSGGQRQRICIARALALNPQFIICDESVSALDVSVQAQVLNLLKELQQEFNLTYIFISHDLSVVKFISDRVMVMNQGKIEEIGSAKTIYKTPETAYTRKLIDAIPTIEKQLNVSH